MRPLISSFVCLLTLCLNTTAFAQYNEAAGQSAPRLQESYEHTDDSGARQTRTRYVAPKRDQFGNANGAQFDLAVDGAFEGQTVAVLQLYPFDFEKTRQALKQKGFSVYRWSLVPPIDEFKKSLAKACQFWIVSAASPQLTDAHIAEIKRFFESGRGVYIWGDNEPYYADANRVGRALFGAEMLGILQGEKVVPMKETKDQKSGIIPNLLLSTGIEQIYEGHTVATIQPHDDLQPLIFGSAGNLVTAFYDKNGRRALFDGGFTRLYHKWDTAGTGRYVMNAAAWLTNTERFGEEVIGLKK